MFTPVIVDQPAAIPNFGKTKGYCSEYSRRRSLELSARERSFVVLKMFWGRPFRSSHLMMRGLAKEIRLFDLKVMRGLCNDLASTFSSVDLYFSMLAVHRMVMKNHEVTPT